MNSTSVTIHGARDVRVSERVVAAPGADEVLVDVAAVGICGSDLHYYKDGAIGSAVIAEPFTPGHEFSARLCADVPAMNLQQGQLVAVDPATPCGACEWCHRGYPNLCPHVIFLGAPPYNGAMTQRLPVPVSALVAIPESISADQAAMLEPLGVCLHALDLARPRLQDTVAVIGCGGIGLGIVELLKLAGCSRIIAVDPQPHRAEKALAMGAHAAATELDVIARETSQRGCDLVVEATNSPDGFAHSIAAAAIGGRVVLVGIPDGDSYSPISAAQARRRGLDLRFSRRMGDVYPRAIALVQQQRVDVDALITHRLDLSEAPQAFARQAEQAPGLIKTILHPQPR